MITDIVYSCFIWDYFQINLIEKIFKTMVYEET